MAGAVFLEADGITLRTVEEDDLSFLRDAINDPRVRRHLPSRPPLNLEQERRYFEEVVVDDDGTVNLLIWTTNQDGQSVRAGTIGLSGLDSTDGSAEIGLLLVPDHWGQGIGTTAARLMIEWAFDERRLHRIVARVREGNEASARIWDRLGFTLEATLREAAFGRGEFVDQHLYAVLAQEWESEAGA